MFTMKRAQFGYLFIIEMFFFFTGMSNVTSQSFFTAPSSPVVALAQFSSSGNILVIFDKETDQGASQGVFLLIAVSAYSKSVESPMSSENNTFSF